MTTATMAAVGLPKARYQVSLIKKGRGHWYEVKDLSGVIIGVYPGVTGRLGVINKPMLVPWAAGMGSARAVAAVLAKLGAVKEDGIETAANRVYELVKQAKASRPKGEVSWAANLGALLAAEFKVTRKTAKLNHELLAVIMEDAANAPDKVKTEAADLGTLAHDAIDRIVKGEDLKEEDIAEAVRVPVGNFRKWLEGSGIQLVLGDTAVASVADQFGGKLDALGWKDGKYIVVDFKTSGSIYPEYALQVAAYATAFEETYGVPVGEAIIVRFDKKEPVWDPAKDLKWVSNLTISYAAFRHASDLQNILKDHEHFV